MSIECTAAVLREQNLPRPYADSKPLCIETIRLDPPQTGELLVKVAGAGLCHSDLSIMEGYRPIPGPGVMGHEGSGEVVEVGAGVRDVRVGDHVVFQFASSCGRCAMCQSGRPNVCSVAARAAGAAEMMGGGNRVIDRCGERISALANLGCFAEYVVVDRGTVVPIDRSVPLVDAALFGCAVMTGAGAVLNTANVRAGESVAIIGLGGVGCNGLLAAKLAGAWPIIALDVNDTKLARAKQLGATHTIDAASPDLLEEVLDITGGGVDYAIEFAGAVEAVRTAYSVLARGGTLVTAGLPRQGVEFGIETSDLVRTERRILGSYMGSCVPVRDVPRFIEQQQLGRLPVEKLIDGYVGFQQINEGFDKLADGVVLRQILDPTLGAA